ncbi:MAG: hypothetical protein WHU94_08755 [Thermogemmata sp.]|jgi:hypothetical protein
MPEHPFEYLAMAAAKYGIDDVQVWHRKQEILDNLTADDMTELARVYQEIERRGDSLALSKWICDRRDDSLARERRQALMLLFLFGGLAERGIAPFSSKTVQLQEEAVPLDWTKLPPELRYLAEPAEKYGKYQFPAQIDAFIDTMTPSQQAELQEIDRRSLADKTKIEDFLDTYRMTEHREAELIYFLFHLIEIIKDSGLWDSVKDRSPE